MPETLKHRVSVGTVDDWMQFEKIAGDMKARGLKLENLSCLGFERVLGAKRLYEQPPSKNDPITLFGQPRADCLHAGHFGRGLEPKGINWARGA